MLQLIRRSTHAALLTGAGAMLIVTTFACTKSDSSAADASATGMANSSATHSADADHVTPGAGLPAGYTAIFDRANAKASDASYAAKDGKWEVKTGPAHILFAAKDSAAGTYTASATFDQLEAPSHPEAYGIFIGGSNLSDPATIKYTYVLVRGNGQYLVKVREGSNTRTVTDWTASPAVPTQDASGKGAYAMQIAVANGSAKVSVNGAPVTTIAAKDAPLDGAAGIRINHNLHVLVTPLAITH